MKRENPLSPPNTSPTPPHYQKSCYNSLFIIFPLSVSQEESQETVHTSYCECIYNRHCSYLFTQMYMYMHITYMYLHTCTCTCTYKYMYIYTHNCKCTCTRHCIHVHVHVITYYTSTNVHVHVYIIHYTHTCTIA